MPKGPGDQKRKRLNAADRRAFRAAGVQLFAKRYGRKAQKHAEPNDRRHDPEDAGKVRRMRPDQLDRLLYRD